MNTYYFLRQGESLQRISLEGEPPRVAEVLNIGPIEPNCKINVSLDLTFTRSPSVLCHEQTTGNVFYYSFDNGSYKKSAVLGVIPPEWQLQLYSLYDPLGEFLGHQIFGHNRSTDPTNPDYQKISVWEVKGFSRSYELGKIGAEWDLMLGDLNGNGTIDIVGRRTTTNSEGKQGDLKVWFLDSRNGLRISSSRDSGSIGLEWKLQVADMNADGVADLFGYNANGDLWVWHNVTDDQGRGRFSGGQTYGTFGSGWQHLQVTFLRGVTRFVDILGLAPASGEVHGWFTNGTGIDGQGVTVGSNAQNWIPVAGSLQTRVA
jgi:hypothetical protein